MTQQTTFGNVRSVKIDDASRRGEIILRTGVSPNVDITLKLSNDHDSAFSAMAAIAGTAVEFGNTGTPAAPPNCHVTYDDSDMEIDSLTFHWH
jgi:hypothetical protein